jgi:hypothetical protein
VVRPAAPTTPDPLAALEQAVTGALRRPPCMVSFSGGHDSSLVLTAAVRVARREQLPLPVPVTWRAVDAPKAEESAWQELVVNALGLTDWVRLQAGDDLDFVGPVSAAVLRRHGLVHPANSYLHAPLLAQATGGTLLTGVGGDQVLGRLPRPRRPRWWPRPDDPDAPYGWLRPAAARRVRSGLRREERARPAAYAGRPDWARRRRNLTLTCATLAVIGAATDTEVVNPFLDAGFLGALCRSGDGPADGGRAGLIGRVFGGRYPDEVVRARPKATFGEVFWRRHTRALLRSWDGTGVDVGVVDPVALRAEWDRPQPDFATTLLVQQVWLATTAGDRSGGVGPPVTGRPVALSDHPAAGTS